MRTLITAWIAILAACSPKNSGGEDRIEDLAPRPVDLTSCAEEGTNLLGNPSFEEGVGSARNTGMPSSTIPAWDGCCNLDGQGLTTTWQVSGAPATPVRCGERAVLVSGAAARGDVLNQTLTVSDGAGRGFLLRAWVLLRSAGDGAEVQIDLFDLGPKAVIRASPPLTTAAVLNTWIPLEVSGQLPQRPAPQVQVRLVSKGTLSAALDDVMLTLR